ncbi:MAG TPA: TonB family protein [Vicinamibacterales bacterium]|nr:TonB family protein [Vicinamibacterales bacterium]
MSDWFSFGSSGLNNDATGGKGFASRPSTSMPPQLDVFTVDEIARAAGVPRAAVHRLVESGELKSVTGSAFFDTRAAVLASLKARRDTASAAQSSASTLSSASNLREEQGLSAVMSSLLHGAVLALLISSTSGAVDMAAKTPRERLVFLAGPGPGGGGGGSGKAPRTPVTRIARPRPQASQSFEPEPQPLPSRALVSPIALVAGDNKPLSPEPDGSGPGVGPGVDDGTGGGAGGGPYRPGSGVEPPRLLREVKAQYTEDARTRGITGDVVLEIVIRSDGSVGDVKVLRGLGYGLDDRAVAAVRNWKFSPARRLGTPVDVIVEVEVEFSLR